VEQKEHDRLGRKVADRVHEVRANRSDEINLAIHLSSKLRNLD
jgi:hypothetical protein